jgi:hypothetical protein
VIDDGQARDSTPFQLSSGVSNDQEASIMAVKWAKLPHNGLERARERMPAATDAAASPSAP